MPQSAPFTLHGPLAYRLKSLATLTGASFRVTLRRLLRGPLLPSWDTNFETAIEFMRVQGQNAHPLPAPAARAYEDSLVFAIPALEQVTLSPVTTPVRGDWYEPRTGTPPGRTLLYLHGGGYVFNAKGHASLISLTALAARARTFALDYRLAPEHPYPAALDDALAAYRWLLAQGISPQNLVIAGDSAGGNLTLVLLLALREANLPLPALAVCLAPWTDLTNPGESMTRNAPYDWISKTQADAWAKAYCGNANPQNPLISPVHGDFSNMPPIYIQIGDSEILADMIYTFTDKAKAQGANVRLEVWKDMIHDFQGFGDAFPASQDALRRLGEVVDEHVN